MITQRRAIHTRKKKTKVYPRNDAKKTQANNIIICALKTFYRNHQAVNNFPQGGRSGEKEKVG